LVWPLPFPLPIFFPDTLVGGNPIRVFLPDPAGSFPKAQKLSPFRTNFGSCASPFPPCMVLCRLPVFLPLSSFLPCNEPLWKLTERIMVCSARSAHLPHESLPLPFFFLFPLLESDQCFPFSPPLARSGVCFVGVGRNRPQPGFHFLKRFLANEPLRIIPLRLPILPPFLFCVLPGSLFFLFLFAHTYPPPSLLFPQRL